MWWTRCFLNSLADGVITPLSADIFYSFTILTDVSKSHFTKIAMICSCSSPSDRILRMLTSLISLKFSTDLTIREITFLWEVRALFEDFLTIQLVLYMLISFCEFHIYTFRFEPKGRMLMYPWSKHLPRNKMLWRNIYFNVQWIPWKIIGPQILVLYRLQPPTNHIKFWPVFYLLFSVSLAFIMS